MDELDLIYEDYDGETIDDIARENGFYIDEDGDWIPIEDEDDDW